MSSFVLVVLPLAWWFVAVGPVEAASRHVSSPRSVPSSPPTSTAPDLRPTGAPVTSGRNTFAPNTATEPPPMPQPTYPPVTVKRTTPVRGPIVDPWRPPSTPYGPGNRGIDIGTVPGAAVVSPADGLVTFAGMVGDSRFVVVESPDGIRITIGFLASVSVRSRQTVRRGQPIGRAGTAVHIGARVGEDYLDPTPLFSGGPPHVRLIAAVDRSRENSNRSTG